MHARSVLNWLLKRQREREGGSGQCSAFGVVNDAFPFCCAALCFDKSDFVSKSSEQ